MATGWSIFLDMEINETQIGTEIQAPAGRAIVTRIVTEGEGRRIFFRYIRNGKQSATERNIYETTK